VTVWPLLQPAFVTLRQRPVTDQWLEAAGAQTVLRWPVSDVGMFIEEKWWLQLQRRGEEQRRRGMTEISTNPRLLTIDQLAERLGITVRHVRRLVAERRLPYYKVGRLVRFDPAEISQWLQTRRIS
jgi:excisionase family DNA binding protein